MAKAQNEIAEKAYSNNDFHSGDPGFLKSRPFHFSITVSGHYYLVFQGSLTPIRPCSLPSNRLPVIQDSNYPAFPIVISPSAWYCRPWSLAAYVSQPCITRGNGTSSIRNTWSDQPSFAQFYSDYDRLVSLPRLPFFLSPADSRARSSWCILFFPLYSLRI